MIDTAGLVLSVLYSILCSTGIYELIDVFLSNNNKLSQRTAILTCLTIGAILRTAFWIKVCLPTEISVQTGIVIFFLPLWFNFAGFSVLALFYAKVLNYHVLYKNAPLYISIVANVLLLLLNLAISLTLTSNLSVSSQKIVSLLYSVYATFLDFVLAAVLYYLGSKFKCTTVVRNVLPQSVEVFTAVNWLVVVCYAIRGICTFSFIFLPTSISSIEFNGHHDQTPIVVLFFLLVTEVIPNFCTMLLLWKISVIMQPKYHVITNDSLEKFIDNSNFSITAIDWDEGQYNMPTEPIPESVSNEEQIIHTNHEIQSDSSRWIDIPGSTTSLSNLDKKVSSSASSSNSSPIIYSNIQREDVNLLPTLNRSSSGLSLSTHSNTSQINSNRMSFPYDHSMLADGVSGSMLHLHKTPSPQLIQVGISHESSPGGAEFMWKQIFAHQQMQSKHKSSSFTTSSLNIGQSQLYNSGSTRGSFQFDKADGASLIRQSSPHLSELDKKDGPIKEKYSNFLGPRDILLMSSPPREDNRSLKK